MAFDLGQCAQLRTGDAVRVFAKTKTHWFVFSTYSHGWIRPEALTPPLTRKQMDGYLHPDRFVVVQRDRVGLYSGPGGEGLLAMARLGARFPLLSQPADGPLPGQPANGPLPGQPANGPLPGQPANGPRPGQPANGPRPGQPANGPLPGQPANGPLRVTAPTPAGLGSAWIVRPHAVTSGYPPLSRRNLLSTAFSLLDSPYGWGGTGDHRDCSRFLMDVFGSFGLELPRNSWNQSRAGVRQVDVATLDPGAKAAAIEEAAQGGIVLRYLKGHIMLFVGRDGDQLYALHQVSGYLVPCEKPDSGASETMLRVNRATVTSLELGRGSSRKSFMERISRLVVLEPEATAPSGAIRANPFPGESPASSR